MESDKLVLREINNYGMVVAPRRGASLDEEDSSNLQVCMKSIFEATRVTISSQGVFCWSHHPEPLLPYS
jgi:hypothetical protein